MTTQELQTIKDELTRPGQAGKNRHYNRPGLPTISGQFTVNQPGLTGPGEPGKGKGRGQMTEQYRVEQELDTDPESWMILSSNGCVVYDFLPEADARLICEISNDLLNQGVDPGFDDVTKDSRWQMFEKIEKLVDVNAHLLEALEAIIEAFDKGEIKFTRKRQADSEPYHPVNVKMHAALAKAKESDLEV